MNPRTEPLGPVPPRLKWAAWSPSVFFGAVVLALVAVGGGLVIYFFDPSQNPFYPGCAFHRLTGWNCPGCGATRALYALLHGRWQVAWRDNALFLLTAAALGARAGWLGMQRLRHRPAPTFLTPRHLLPWLVIAVIFGVLRNFPAFAFLSP